MAVCPPPPEEPSDGIRKVLGTSALSVEALLSTDVLKLVAMAFELDAPVAFVLSTPAAYNGMSQWLQDFRINKIGSGSFLLAGLLAALIALVAVSSQVLRAAWTNPATAIRQK